MNIELNLFVSLSKYKPEDVGSDSWIVKCSEGDTIHTLLNRFKVPEKEVKVIFINGVHAKLDAALNDGDRVGVFPPVGGG